MNDIQSLRQELTIIFNDLKSGSISSKDAAELNNCAGKIINSLKVELIYRSLKNESPVIPFLEGKEDHKLIPEASAKS